MRVTATAAALRQWCVYTVSWFPSQMHAPAEVLFVGAATMQSVLHLEAARSNSVMQPLFAQNAPLQIDVLLWMNDAASAEAATALYVDKHKPYANINGTTIEQPQRRTGAVRCTTTGDTYATAAAAASAAGVTGASMSMHLNRRPGYSTCAGKVYERVTHE